MDSFEQFYPSEVARLVLGYLNDINCLYAWEIFLVECSDLQEHYTHYCQGKKHSTNVNGKSLRDILNEYCKLKNQVASETPSQVDPAVSNEESTEKNLERENSDATYLPSFAAPSNVGIYVPEKVNQSSTLLNHVTEVGSESLDAAVTGKVFPAHDSTKASDGTNSGRINTETGKFCDSNPPGLFKRPASVQQCLKRKSLPKKKQCCHKITQTDVLSVQELKLMYTIFRQHMAVAPGDSIGEEKALKSVDGSKFRNSESDNRVVSISSNVTEENCFVVSLNKRKSFVPKRLLIDSVVHDKVEKQANVNLKETLKDVVILEEFLSYQPLVKSICNNINRAICKDVEGSTNVSKCPSLQKVANENIIKIALDKTESEPLLHSYLPLNYCRKEFVIGKLKCRPLSINTDNQITISMESNCTETYFSHDTSFMEAPQIDSSNIFLEKNANIESDININNKRIFENLEKICTSDIDFDDETISVDDCSTEINGPSVKVQDGEHKTKLSMPKCSSEVHSNPKKALSRKKVMPINRIAKRKKSEQILSMQNITTMNSIVTIPNSAPTTSVIPLENTSPKDLISFVEKTTTFNSVLNIQNMAPVDSVASIENENVAPMISGMPIQTTAPSDNMMTIGSIPNFNDGNSKPVFIGAPFTSQIIPSTNQLQQVSNITTDSIFLPTNQNLCQNVSNLSTTNSIFLPTNQNVFGNNVIVGSNASNNISNLVFPTFPNSSIFPPVNPMSSPQFPYSGLSTLFVPNSSSNAFPMQNSIQYSLIINPNINWNCTSSNDVGFHAQAVIKDNSLQNQLVNNNIDKSGTEEVKSCAVEGQPEDDGTVDLTSIKQVALKKKNINSIKSPAASIQKRKIVVLKKTIPKTLNIKAIKTYSPLIRKRIHSQEIQNTKLRLLLPLPSATEDVTTIKSNVVPLTSKVPNAEAFCNESADTDCGIENLSTEIEVDDMQILPLKSLLSSASLLAAKDAEANSVITRSLDFFGNAEINEASRLESDNLSTEIEVDDMQIPPLKSLLSSASLLAAKDAEANSVITRSLDFFGNKERNEASRLESNKIAHQSSTKPISGKKALNKSKRKMVTKEDSDISILTPEEIDHVPSKAILDKKVSKNVSNEPKKKNVDAHINDKSKPDLSVSKPKSLDSQLSLPTTMTLEVLDAMQKAIDMKSSRVLQCNKRKFSSMKSEIFDIYNEEITEVSNFIPNVLKPKVEANETMDLNKINSELHISNEGKAPASENETLDNICAFLKAEDFENSQHISSSNSGLGHNTFLKKSESSTPSTLDASLGETENCLSTGKNMSEQKNVDLFESRKKNLGQVNVNEAIKRNSSRKVKVVSPKAVQHSKKNKKGSKCPITTKKKLIPSVPILKSKEFLSNTQPSDLEKSSVVEKGNKNTITHKYPLRTHHKMNTQGDFQLDSESDKIKKQCSQNDSKVVKFLGLTGKLENELDKQQMHPEKAYADSFTEQMSQSLLVSSNSTIKPFAINTNEISSPELFIDEPGTCQETEDEDAIKYGSSDQTKAINRQVLLDCATNCQPFLKELTVTIERMDSETITKAMFPNQVTNVDIGNLPSPFSTNSDTKRTLKSRKNKAHSSTIHNKISAPAKKQKLMTSTLPKRSILRSKQRQKPEDFPGGNELGDLPIENKSKESIACSLNENSVKSDLSSPLKKFTIVQLKQDKVIQLERSDTITTGDVLIKNKLGETIACSANEMSRKSNIISPFKKFPVVQLEQNKEIQLEQDKVIQLEQDKVIQLEQDRVMQLEQDKVIQLEQDRVIQLEQDKVIQLEQDKVIQLEQDRVMQLEQDKVIQLEQDKVIQLEQNKVIQLEQDKGMQLVQDKVIQLNSSDIIKTGDALIKSKSEESIACSLNDNNKSDLISPLKKFTEIQLELEEDIIPSSLMVTDECFSSNKIMLAKSHKKVPDIDTMVDISSKEQKLNREEVEIQQIQEKSLETFSAEETVLNQNITGIVTEMEIFSPSKTVILADSHKKDSEIDLVNSCISSEEHIIGDNGSKSQQISKKSSGEIQPLLSGEDTVPEENQHVSPVSIENENSNSSPAAMSKKHTHFDALTESIEHTIGSDEQLISSSLHTSSNEPNKTFSKSILKKNPGRHFSIPSCVKSYEEWKADNSSLVKIRRSRPTLKIVGFQTPEKENVTMRVSNAKVSNKKLKEMSASTRIPEIPSQADSSTLDSKLYHQQNIKKFRSEQGLFNFTQMEHFKDANNTSVKDLSTSDNNFQTISSQKSVNLGHEKESSSKHPTLSTQNQRYKKKVNIQSLSEEGVEKDTMKEVLVAAKNEFVKNSIESAVENQTSSCDKLNQGSEKNSLLEELPSSSILIPSSENEKVSVELLVLGKCDKENSNNLTAFNVLSVDKSSKLKSYTAEEIPPVDALSVKVNKLAEQIISPDQNIVTEDSAVLTVFSNDIKSDSCDKKLCTENNELPSPNVSIKVEEEVSLAVLAVPNSTKTQTESQNPDVAKRHKFTLNSSKCNSEELLSALSAEMVKSIKGVNPEVLLEQMREYGLDNLLNLLSEKE